MPSPSWNIDTLLIDKMRESLANVDKKWWCNQAHCKSNRQYLKELASEPNLQMVRKQAESLVGVYMKNFVTKHYNCLMHFRVGALRSKGEASQFELQGTLHRDYQDEVNQKLPDERPQSMILALDPFNLLYELEPSSDGSLKTVFVDSGQAVLFTSSLRHAGGSNGTNGDNTWKYRLFAYIVSDEADFPSEIGTRVNMKK